MVTLHPNPTRIACTYGMIMIESVVPGSSGRRPSGQRSMRGGQTYEDMVFGSFPHPLPEKLHLGSAHLVQQGWLNTDVTKQLFVARLPGLAHLLFALRRMTPATYDLHRRGVYRHVYYLDVTRRFPFPDNSFACVYSSHMLEHLYPDDAQRCVREIYRVLRPGGLLRLALPDLDFIVANYDPQDSTGFLISIFQGTSRRTHRLARHWWHYNAHSLTALLTSAGFCDVRQCRYREGADAAIAQLDNRPNSLFMEARTGR